MELLAFTFPEFDKYVLGLEWRGFGIRWYALAYVAGILLGWWYAVRLARKDQVWGPRAPIMTRDQVDDLILWITVGVIVGGRVGSMLFYSTSALWEQPLEIFKIWKGGMSFHGGLLGVMLAMFLFARTQKQPVWSVDEQKQPVMTLTDRRMSVLAVADLVAPCVPIGLFFGRVANFINGELWGRSTDLPWGFYINDDSPLPHHPSQLYEAFLEGIVLFIILRMATHAWGMLKKPGLVTGVFLAGYAVFRILVEFVREPDQGLENLPLGLTMGMILSLPMLIAGIYLINKARAQPMLSVAEPAPKAAAAPKPAAAKPAARKPAPKSAASAKPRAAKPKAK